MALRQQFRMLIKFYVIFSIIAFISLQSSPVMAAMPEDIMKSTGLYDNRVGNALGWRPDGNLDLFFIRDRTVNPLTSTILITINSESSSNPICQVTWMGKGAGFDLRCDKPPGENDALHYTVFNLNKIITPPVPEELLTAGINDTVIIENITANTETLNERIYNATK